MDACESLCYVVENSPHVEKGQMTSVYQCNCTSKYRDQSKQQRPTL